MFVYMVVPFARVYALFCFSVQQQRVIARQLAYPGGVFCAELLLRVEANGVAQTSVML